MMPPRGSKPARVLVLHPSDELYGADRVLLNLLTGLDRARFEPLVVLANDLPYDGLLSGELRARDIEVRHLPIAVARRKYLTPREFGGFARRVRRSTRQISQLIVAERIDLVYSNTLAVWTGALAAARTQRPHLWHVHEIIARPAALSLFMRRFVPAYSQRIVCVSQAAFDHLLISAAARAKGAVLPNGLDVAEWTHATGRERVRVELGCAQEDILVGMVGRVSALKAPDLFVAAANDLLARGLPVRFVIAGDVVPGQEAVREALRNQIAVSPAPGRFHLLGFRRDIPDVTAALDLIVVPSREPESFSLVSVQAMLAGKPVVATRVGALPETIVDGQTGILVPPGQIQALANAIDALTHDSSRRAALGRAGQQWASARFSLQRQVYDFNDLLRQAIQAPAARRVGERVAHRIGIAAPVRPLESSTEERR